MYGKIFKSIYDGTLYGQWEAIVTFEQMIILADDQGIIDMTPFIIVARTSIPLNIIEKGIKILESEDPYSRTDGEEGRRILRLDDHRPWGWIIVNYSHYRRMASHEDKRKNDRERIANKRKSSKNNDVADCRNESQTVESVVNVAYTDTDTDSKDMRNCDAITLEFETDFWPNFPFKKDKKKALRAYKKLNASKRKKARESITQFFADKKPDYYIYPATYLNGERWEDIEQGYGDEFQNI